MFIDKVMRVWGFRWRRRRPCRLVLYGYNDALSLARFARPHIRTEFSIIPHQRRSFAPNNMRQFFHASTRPRKFPREATPTTKPAGVAVRLAVKEQHTQLKPHSHIGWLIDARA